MATKKLFFCLCANHPHQPYFGAKILLNLFMLAKLVTMIITETKEYLGRHL